MFPSSSPDVVSGVIFSVFYNLSATRETKQQFLLIKVLCAEEKQTQLLEKRSWTASCVGQSDNLEVRRVKRDVSHVCSQIQNHRFIEERDTSCKDGTRSPITSERISGCCVYFLVMHSRVSSTGPAHQTLHSDDITDFKSLFSFGGKFYRSNTSAVVGFQTCLISWMNTITFKQTSLDEQQSQQLILWTRPLRHSAPQLIVRTWTLSERGFGCWLLRMTSESSFLSAHNVRTYWKPSPHRQWVLNKQTPADTDLSVPEDVTGRTDVWASCRGAWRRNNTRAATRF